MEACFRYPIENWLLFFVNLNTVKYAKFFCEENIWHLCQNKEFAKLQKFVLFISNIEKKCPFWFQKSNSKHEPIWWDYHVTLAVNLSSWYIYDLDTTLSFPVELENYVFYTFKGLSRVGKDYFPNFKIIDAERYAKEFYSDRSHMKDKNGNWIADPPTWPLIVNSKELNIDDLFNFTHSSKHKIYTMKEMSDFFKTVKLRTC